MKKIILILIIMCIPLCIFSQELGMDFSFSRYKHLSEKELRTRLFWTNTGTTGCVILATGGIIAIGAGAYYGTMGALLTAASISSESNASPLVFFLSAAVMTGGYSLAILGYGVSKASIDAIGSLNVNRRMIKVELKQFEPISYKDSPGIGVGISIPL